MRGFVIARRQGRLLSRPQAARAMRPVDNSRLRTAAAGPFSVRRDFAPFLCSRGALEAGLEPGPQLGCAPQLLTRPPLDCRTWTRSKRDHR
jgi:hypothetical protein